VTRSQSKIDASQVVALLAKKHGKDVFVAECKTGKTWGDNYMRLDAWALAKSWSPWRSFGYEVKVSRHDFEQDQKWGGYLPYCHCFSFVCPAGLIKGEDLPAEVGIYWVSPNAERLVTKRAPVARKPDPEKLCQLMSYVLMSRTVIVGDMWEAAKGDAPAEDPKDQRMAAMRKLLDQTEARKELAHMVQGHVRKTAQESLERLARAERLMADVNGFKARLAQLGIKWDTDGWSNTFAVHSEINLLGEFLPEETLRSLRNLSRQLTYTADEIERLRNERAQGKSSTEEEPC